MIRFLITYEPSCAPSGVSYPNGVSATMSFDTVGQLTSKWYADSTNTMIVGWLRSYNAWGQVSEEVGGIVDPDLAGQPARTPDR